MTKTINFCGDSFCANKSSESWTTILSHMLGYEIFGTGKNGTAYEHAIKTFNPKVDVTVFCWTEPHRIYHATESLNMTSVEEKKHKSRVHAAAHEYYKYLHSYEIDFDRKERDFFWFDEKILKHYKGKIVHLFSFENAIYPFKHGVVVRKPLELAKKGFSSIYPNHMTKENNRKLANSIYKLLT